MTERLIHSIKLILISVCFCTVSKYCLASEVPSLTEIQSLAQSREFNKIEEILEPFYSGKNNSSSTAELSNDYLYHFLNAKWSSGNGVRISHLKLSELLVSNYLQQTPVEYLDVAKAIKIRGHMKQFLADYWGALEDFKEVVSIRQKISDIPPTQLISAMNQVAVISQELNLVDDAKRYYENAIEITKEKLGPEHIFNIALTVNYAMMLNDQGFFEDAAHLYQQAIAKAENTIGFEHQFTLVAYNNLGDNFFSMGNLQSAKLFTEKALAGKEKVLGKNTFEYVLTLNNLANIERDSGNFSAAQKHYEEASELVSGVVGSSPHFYSARLLRDRALLEELKGNLTHFLSMSKDALSKMTKVYPAGTEIEVLVSRLQYADALYHSGYTEEAQTHYGEIIETLSNLGQADNPLMITASLRHLLTLLDNQEAKIEEDLSNFVSLLKLRFNVDSLVTGNSFIFESQRMKEPVGTLLAKLYEKRSLTQSEISLSLEIAHYAQLSALSWTLDTSILNEATPDFRALQQAAKRYRTVQGEYQQLLLNEQTPAEKLTHLANEMSDLISKLKADFQPQRSTVPFSKNNGTGINSNTMNMEFFFGERSFRWAYHKGKITWEEIDISSDMLLATISDLERSLKSEATTLKDLPPYNLGLANSLGLTLLKGIKTENVESIGIVASPLTIEVPWNALIIDNQSLPMIEHFSQFTKYETVKWLSDSVSISFKATITSVDIYKSKQPTSLLGVANSDFNNDLSTSNLNLMTLNTVGLEIDAIAKALDIKKLKKLEGNSATRHKVNEALHGYQYDVISFATHSIGITNKNQEIGLVLASEDHNIPYVVLTPSDISDLNLTDTMVIMSGCSTGAELSNVDLIEKSLVQSWFFAGAESIVATQWAIETQAHTQALINLLENKPLHNNLKIKHPVFWAGLMVFQK